MPEGHTLLRLAGDLNAAFGGQRVEVSSPQGRFADGAAAVDGHVLELAESVGKHLFIRFEGGNVIHVHLGLIGGFHIDDGPPPDPVGAVRLRLVGPMAYADLRGATTCELITAESVENILGRLGADPLRPDADPEKAFRRIRNSKKPIGALLMDQSVLAGVGNIYRAESLFRARLHPLTLGEKVSKRRWDALWHDLVDLWSTACRPAASTQFDLSTNLRTWADNPASTTTVVRCTCTAGTGSPATLAAPP